MKVDIWKDIDNNGEYFTVHADGHYEGAFLADDPALIQFMEGEHQLYDGIDSRTNGIQRRT